MALHKITVQKRKAYIISTLGYALVGLLGIAATILFLEQRRWFVAFIGLLIAYVSFDNVFCATRARAYGMKAKGKWTVPFIR